MVPRAAMSLVRSPSTPSSSSSSAATAAMFLYWKTADSCTPRRKLLVSRQVLRRAISANGGGGGGAADEEFVRRVKEMAVEFQCAGGGGGDDAGVGDGVAAMEEQLAVGPETPGWPASVERSASAVGLPLSLRMLKKKKKREKMAVVAAAAAATEAVESSVRRAFCSMVFIIRELQRFAIQMRPTLLLDDLNGVLSRVQAELHASFVWLFQHIFAPTPSLMVSVMLLLANFTVHSMTPSVAAVAVAAPMPTPAAVIEAHTQEASSSTTRTQFDSAAVKTFSLGKTASVGGSGGGGGGRIRPVVGATDDGRPDNSIQRSSKENEAVLWNRVVEEAATMSGRDASWMDGETLRRLVAPVTAEMETEDHAAHLATELKYRRAVTEDPWNSLVLSNFAQFLFVVLHDHDRAEQYFRRAVAVKPADAEALSRYATFLWKVRGDLEAAEETFQQAIAADPGNPFHAASYAHFLWNTGAEDTCFPLDAGEA